MIKINTRIGTFYIDEEDCVESEYGTLLDSDKVWFGSMNSSAINDLKNIKHISELVDFGFCENLMFAQSRIGLINEYINYINENFTLNEEPELNKKEMKKLKKSIASNIRRIGHNYFIVDFDI